MIVKSFDYLSKLKNSSVLITGSTGLIGSTIVDLLLMANEVLDTNITVFACGRNRDKFDKRFEYNSNLFFEQYDANLPIKFDLSADYIINCAGIASPELYVEKPVETIDGNYQGMLSLLKFGKKCNAKKAVYVSSSEVYGVIDGNDYPLKENNFGYVDPLNIRSSYANGKRITESICSGFSKEYDFNVSIVRPGHIYGPAAGDNDNRVSSLFIREALSGNNIVMKSEGKQIRSYTYVVDCANAILCVLISGENGQAYNISTPASIISIKEMAEIISGICNIPLVMELPNSADTSRSNPMSNSSLDSKKIQKLGWKGVFDASKGFEDTIRILNGY